MLSITCLYVPLYVLNLGSKTKQTSKPPVDANIPDSPKWQDSFNIAPFPCGREAQLERIKFQPTVRVYEPAVKA